MLTTTPTIKIIYEVGKHVALKAKGLAALIVATGLGAAVVKAMENARDLPEKTWHFINSKFGG